MFRLKLEVEETPSESFGAMSFGGKTPDDLTEIALRTVLFGEPNPIADKHMGFMIDIDDPLQPLRETPVSEEIVRPISELLVTDVLVGSGRASLIQTFRLGVAVRGRRSLALTWETPKRYSNERVAVRTVNGEVTL
jgi:hypothetical protein